MKRSRPSWRSLERSRRTRKYSLFQPLSNWKPFRQRAKSGEYRRIRSSSSDQVCTRAIVIILLIRVELEARDQVVSEKDRIIEGTQLRFSSMQREHQEKTEVLLQQMNEAQALASERSREMQEIARAYTEKKEKVQIMISSLNHGTAGLTKWRPRLMNPSYRD